MATERILENESGTANADLSAHQNKIVKVSGAKQYALCGAGEQGVGVNKSKPSAAGRPMTVAVLGKSKVVSDGSGTAIAVGDNLGSDATGRAIKVTAAGAWCIGKATEASSAANVVIGVDLLGPYTLAG